MCDKYEQKQCKKPCRRRRRSHSCDGSKPEPCQIPPKFAAIQAGGLSTTTVPQDGIVHFTNTVTLSSYEPSIKLVDGVFQFEECGVYSISYSIRLDTLNPSILGTYKVELRLAELQMGICPAPLGGCWVQSWSSAGTKQTVPYSASTPDSSGLIRQTVLVNVQNRCTQLALVNASNGGIVLDANLASLCITKIN